MDNIVFEFQYYQIWEIFSFGKIFYCWIPPNMMFKLPIYHILVIYEYASIGISDDNNDIAIFFHSGLC